jgi:hypothetical protein
LKIMRLVPALAVAIFSFAPLTCLAESLSPQPSDLQPGALDLRAPAASGAGSAQRDTTSALARVGGVRSLDVRLRRLERLGTVEARYAGERSQHAGFGVEIPMGSNALLTSGYELSRREDGLGGQSSSPVDHGFRIGASLQF